MNKIYKSLSIIPLAAITQIQNAQAAVYMTTQEAQKYLFKNATSFVSNKITFTKEQKSKIKEISKIRDINDEQQIWKVFQGNKQIGFFVMDYVYGKHEFITYAVAINMDGAVMATEILEYKESYGDEVRQDWWKKQFVGKKISDNFVLDEGIKNISGATLSCKHIADGVKRVLTIYDLYLKN